MGSELTMVSDRIDLVRWVGRLSAKGTVMNLVDRLEGQSGMLVDEAVTSLGQARSGHYAHSGKQTNRERIQALFDLLVRCLRERSLLPMVEHAERVAGERFEAGFGLGEVQTAFNVLEEAVWMTLVQELPSDELAEGLGLVGTVLGAGKDELARAYVSLAAQHKVPSMDMKALFLGV